MSKRRWSDSAAVPAIAALIVLNFLAPASANIRQFDPNEVARLDTVMWRSYYDKQRLRLFRQTVKLVRNQYHLSRLNSLIAAYEATRAAFVFKGGKSRADYEKALPYLVTYFDLIKKANGEIFDIEKAAQLELEWWIVHRQRESHASGDLEKALAMASAELYHVSTDNLMDYAKLRAEAMILRDEKAKASGVSEEDWNRIGQLLQGSWRSLWNAVNFNTK